MLSVCLSVTRVNCEETTEARISFHWKVAKCLNVQRGKFDGKIRRCPLDLRAQTRAEWFSLCFATQYLRNGARQSLGHN